MSAETSLNDSYHGRSSAEQLRGLTRGWPGLVPHLPTCRCWRRSGWGAPGNLVSRMPSCSSRWGWLHQAGQADDCAHRLLHDYPRHRVDGRSEAPGPDRAAGADHFELVSTLALILGLLVVNLGEAGVGLNLDVRVLDASVGKSYLTKAHASGQVDFLLNIIPTSFWAFASRRSAVGAVLFHFNGVCHQPAS